MRADDAEAVRQESARIGGIVGDLLDEQHRTKADLARHLGKDPPYATQLVKGELTRDMVRGLWLIQQVEAFLQADPGDVLRIAGYIGPVWRGGDEALRPFLEAARSGDITIPPDLLEMLRAIVHNAELRDRDD